MSCNGCRVLRKGCSDECMLRHCLQWIQSPQAQAHATLFVAKFFGRAALMSFLSAVPPSQRPPLFESLLYEAVGRSINPVNGAVGLLWTGNWRLCQLAVQTVLRGGALNPLPPDFFSGGGRASLPADDDSFDESNQRDMREASGLSLSSMLERKVMINGNINISSHDFQARYQRLPSEEEDSETTAFQTTQRKLLTLFF